MSGNSWANMGQECIKCHINVYPHKQVSPGPGWGGAGAGPGPRSGAGPLPGGRGLGWGRGRCRVGGARAASGDGRDSSGRGGRSLQGLSIIGPRFTPSYN